jgi:Flp pilus assembly protein TadG
MNLKRNLSATGKDESGQLLILVALVLPVLILFAGFAIDFGFGFLTRAELAKASDATALTIMHNLGQGQAVASQRGQDVFALNYNANSSLNASAPTLTTSYSIDPTTNEPVVNVVATATIKTFFIRLAGFSTLSVSNFSQATRPPVLISLVLDKSGSMKFNGGQGALPPSVISFLGYFMQGADRIGVVSFSSIANPDVPITTNFQTPITNFVTSMPFGGATFAQAGLQYGENEVTGVVNPPPHAVPVVVFFTDGWANTNNDCLPYGSKTCTAINYGGCSPVEQTVGWCGSLFCMYPSNGGTISNWSPTAGQCGGTTTFHAQDPSITNPATQNITNVAKDAIYRTEQLANSMRAAGITVYSIGLGDKIDTTYLQQIANDPSLPTPEAGPVGEAVFAPTAADLQGAFQQIADKILLRLTQ